jgi:tripartite-type tricarboxylate transporter receptor subunit TctC
MITISRAAAAAGFTVLVLTGSAVAQAQNYPTRPIRYVVAFSPGGVNDILARIVGQKLVRAGKSAEEEELEMS